ncbi:hypothetical protein HC024_21080, partial [Methylococcaceae bacterium WWC4]|nr:hypothetical protein [Methylococcaceae bacterium WWC4]
NVDGHKPGAQVEMYSYDHDLEEFVAIGLGTVSTDGSIIKSNEGVGVIKAGWHCGSQPGGSGCAYSAECQTCSGNCQLSNKPDGQIPGAAKCTLCSSGSKVPPKTDQECCSAISFGGGFVVCCNTVKLACAGSSFTGGNTGGDIVKKCVIEHEQVHYGHIDCPTGANECDTTRPDFKAGEDSHQDECDASKVEVACLRRERPSCGSDAACNAAVDSRIATMISYGNGTLPGYPGGVAGCFP